MTVISTSQAPDAKPVAVSMELTTEWQDVITVPRYEIPEETFGGGVIEVPAVAELITPMIVCNKVANTASISIRVFREDANTSFMLANEVPIVINNLITVPLNGQFVYDGDILQAKSDSNNSIDITLSYTVGQAEQDTLPGEV